MYIARILYPVEVLGPGKRIGIWFCGCPRRCKGCSNPELWEFQERYKVEFSVIKNLMLQISSQHRVDGFTLTGGDPLYQFEAFRQIVDFVSDISNDILVYTIEERNNGCILRGSDNQQIYILNNSLKEKYENYLSTAQNQIQNFATVDGYISVGIHNKDFKF